MADMDMVMETGDIKSGYIVDGIITPGLNLLVLPKEQRERCFGMSFPLFTAKSKGIWKEATAGSVVWFSLEENKEKSRQMFDGYTMTPHQIFDIYAYKNGYFGNKIKDTMEIFLKDNPHIKLVVIDSIEEIVKEEIGHMECGHACEILHNMRQAAIQQEVPILVTVYGEDFGGGNKWDKVSDVVLRLEEGENQNSHEYTLHLKEKDKTGSKLEIVLDSKSGNWNWITTK